MAPRGVLFEDGTASHEPGGGNLPGSFSFVPTDAQRRQIEAGRGTIRVTQAQIDAVRALREKTLSGWGRRSNPLDYRDWRTPGFERVLCGNCGKRGDQHRGYDGKCPGPGPEPKWPSTIKDEARAGALYDKRMARYWAQRKTYFKDPR